MLVTDNKRTASFEQVVFIDLETFGIYRRPVPTLSENQVEMNLQAFDEGLGADLGASSCSFCPSAIGR